MNEKLSTEIEPLFIDSAAGRVFALYFAPHGAPRGAILYLPPLAEELNRCRHLAAEQARIFAASGYACLVLDLFGTGDSAGELADANWNIWRTDVTTAADWLEHKTGMPVTLWGLRFGALLAADIASSAPERFSRLLFWQPVTDGKTYLTQFLRLRIAFLMDRGLPPETTDDMRNRLKAGEPVVVSGYVLPGNLACSIDQIRLGNLANLKKIQIDWFENVSEPGKPLSIASQKIIENMRTQGTLINVHAFTAPPIWALHERDEAPDLLSLTTEIFRGQT